MPDEEFTTSIRKFLKHLGVTGHQLIEDELKYLRIWGFSRKQVKLKLVEDE